MHPAVQCLLYDEIRSIRTTDGQLHLNDAAWHVGGRTSAEWLANALKAIQRSKSRDATVEQVIKENMQRGLEVDQRIAMLEKKTLLLTILCSIYAIWFLLFLPVALFRLPTLQLLWFAGIPILLLHLACGGLFVYVHRRLLPEARAARWETFTKMFLCPPLMIRAFDPIVDQAEIPGDAVSALIRAADPRQTRPHVQRI
jgi:hypothetical protein